MRLLYKTYGPDRKAMFILGLCSLVEGAILVLSLGFLNTDIRAMFLFKDDE
jgi:hypothetical protein